MFFLYIIEQTLSFPHYWNENKWTTSSPIFCGQGISPKQNPQPLSCDGAAAFYKSYITLRTIVVWSWAKFMPVKVFRKQFSIIMFMVWKFCMTMCRHQRNFDWRRRPGNPQKHLNHPSFYVGSKNVKVTRLHDIAWAVLVSKHPAVRFLPVWGHRYVNSSIKKSLSSSVLSWLSGIARN